MKIRTHQDMEAFKDAIEKCSRTVWLIGPDGEQYDLKSDRELRQGLERLTEDDAEVMELFASNYADEMVMMDFYSHHAA
jgi:hypothetical protein